MEFIRDRQTRYGQSGTIGGIPPEYVAEKYEVTQLVEPEDMLYEHMRETLKDNTCEPPSFESDMPRYDNGAKNLLNVQYEGSRSKVKPDMPDLYIANTEGDSRGTRGLPHMYHLRKATEDRMRFKDLRSTATSDQSVDSGVWSAHSINQAMRGTWKGLKQRQKWFSRSLSAGATGVGLSRNERSSALNYIEADEEKHHELAEVTTQVFTPSAVVLGPGHKPVIVGARQVPTHEFHVAKYGDAPRSSVYRYDARNNQFKAEVTADFAKSEERTLKGLAMVMANEAGACKANPTTDFDGSTEGMADRRRGKHGNARKTLDTMLHTTEYVEALVAESQARHGRANQADDLKQQRLHRIIDEDIYTESELTKHLSIKLINDPFTVAFRRQHALVEHEAEDGVEAANYAKAPRATAKQARDMRDQALIDLDAQESKRVYRGKTNTRHGPGKNAVTESRNIDTTLYGESSYAERHTGAMGNKSRHLRYSQYEDRDSLGDISNSMSKAGCPAPIRRNHAQVSRRIAHVANMDIGEPDNEPMHVDMRSGRL